jgi:two-component system nitrate/nitrite response regulator NarL
MRVMVCSHIRLYRDGLAGFLNTIDGLVLVATTGNDERCVQAARSLLPDVVLLDAATPDGAATVLLLRRAAPGLRVIALAVPDDEAGLIALAEAGVAAYLTGEESLEDLRGVLAAVERGEARCSPRIAALLLGRLTALACDRESERAARVALTPRELEIVELIAQGLSNKQIALSLRIEVATVKNHVHNILEKLGVDRRGKAVEQLRAGAIRSAS